MKKVTFLVDDLKVIFRDHMQYAGFLHEGQEIEGFEFRTRKIKRGGDYYKDLIPAEAADLFAEGETEEIQKIIVLLTNSPRKSDSEPDSSSE